jgi:hypothetical protein
VYVCLKVPEQMDADAMEQQPSAHFESFIDVRKTRKN